MQPSMEHYYMNSNNVNNYSRVYDFMNMPTAAAYPMSNNIFSTSSSATNNSASQSQQQQQQDWRNMEQQQYVYQQQAQRNNSSSASGIHYLSQQHHQDPISLVQQHDARLYKALNGEILSPVDSGIGADMSLLDQVTKNEFFTQNVSVVQQQQSQVYIELVQWGYFKKVYSMQV